MDSPLLVFYRLLTVLQTINRSVDHRLGPYYFKEIFMSYLIIASCSGKDKVAVAFTMPMTLYVILFWTQLPSKQQFWCEYVHILNSLGFQDISVVCQCFSSNMEGESFLCIFWLTKTWFRYSYYLKIPFLQFWRLLTICVWWFGWWWYSWFWHWHWQSCKRGPGKSDVQYLTKCNQSKWFMLYWENNTCTHSWIPHGLLFFYGPATQHRVHQLKSPLLLI